jgi:hypothetical protein
MPLTDDSFAALTDIRAALEAVDQVGCHVFIFAPPSRASRDKWHRLGMDGAVAERLVEAARVSLTAIETRAAEDHALAEFDFDAMADRSIGLLRVADTPAIADWLNSVPGDDWPVRFAGDEQILERARFYATRLNFADGRYLTLFRGSRGLTVALRQRNAVAAAFSRENDRMVAIDGPVITFDGTIDFFEWEGIVFIVNLLTFESVTNIREVTIRKSAEAMAALRERFDLGNTADGVTAEIGKRTRLAKRLAAALQHGLIADIDAQNVVRRAEEKHLRLRCSIENGNARFDVDPTNRGEVEDFVDLMTDLFLRSPVTGREWEAVVKRAPRDRR